MADDHPAAEPSKPSETPSGEPAAPKGKDSPGGESADAGGDSTGEDRTTDEAYWRGRRTFRPRDYTASAYDSKIGFFVAGDYYSIFTDSGDRKISGLVREKVLERIRKIYALVPGYENMLGALVDNRLIVLYGLPDNGLTTTAVRLLDEASGGQVARMDLDHGIGSVREQDLTENRGYVVRFAASSVSHAPTETQLDALGELLAKRSCWCVIVENANSGPGELDEYAFEYQPPDPRDVLRKHTVWLLRRDDPRGTIFRELLDLAERERLVDEFGPAPSLAGMVRLAELLVRHHRGQLDLNELRVGCALFVADQVRAWFGGLRHPNSSDLTGHGEILALSAFRIALAVLNISTFHQVAEAARKLERRIAAVIDSAAAKTKQTVVTLDRRDVLTRSRAHSCPGIVVFGADTVVRGKLVEYVDDRFPTAVLEYVWQEYDWIREPIVEWLCELGESDSEILQVRAAQAAGALATMDFDYTYRHLIRDWASADIEKKRRFAAIALDQAAQDSEVWRSVWGFLRQWRRGGEEARRWTTAAALGYGLGLENIDETLNSLRILGTPDETLRALAGPTGATFMVTVVSRSLCQLLAFGAVEPVLTTLTDWLVHRKTSMRTLAREAVKRLIGRRGFHSDYLDESGARGRQFARPTHDRWPLLLALQHDDPRLAEPIAELLRRALRGRDSNVIADRFRSWIRTADGDTDCLAALHDFLPLLIENPDDAARLVHLITNLRHEWAEPLSPDLADSLEAAIRSADTGEAPPWTMSMTS